MDEGGHDTLKKSRVLHSNPILRPLHSEPNKTLKQSLECGVFKLELHSLLHLPPFLTSASFVKANTVGFFPCIFHMMWF